MIKSFAHKGLEEFYETGSKNGIQPDHAQKLGRILDRLDACTDPRDMDLPGYRLYSPKGDNKGMWSVAVNGNWRMTFCFEGQDAYLVDYLDHHLGM
ncbi:MAG: type II toxin-antitoxin system RelE/ParE family toxin [Lachnospiraceae bacterium]|nr:type II toxin-antitoxin system RelE/ParE family toxin [Lachnospiraceae bacterium]